MPKEDYPPVPPIPKEFWEDEHWAYDNYSELVKMYPNQWVAVVNKQVVAAGKNGTKVVAIAKQKTGRKDFPIIFVEKGVRVYQDQSEDSNRDRSRAFRSSALSMTNSGSHRL